MEDIEREGVRDTFTRTDEGTAFSIRRWISVFRVATKTVNPDLFTIILVLYFLWFTKLAPNLLLVCQVDAL